MLLSGELNTKDESDVDGHVDDDHVDDHCYRILRHPRGREAQTLDDGTAVSEIVRRGGEVRWTINRAETIETNRRSDFRNRSET